MKQSNSDPAGVARSMTLKAGARTLIEGKPSQCIQLLSLGNGEVEYRYVQPAERLWPEPSGRPDHSPRDCDEAAGCYWRPSGRIASRKEAMAVGLYRVKRYQVDEFEVEVQAGERVTRAQLLDRAEDPCQVRIQRETLRRKRFQDTLRTPARRNPKQGKGRAE